MSHIDVSHFRPVRVALAALALAAAGCTVRVVVPEVPVSHPAHPDAQAAPLPEPSPLLDSYRPVAPPPEMAPMDHEGMDHGDMDHGEMDHGDMDHEGMDHDAMDHGEETAAEEEEAEPEEAEDPHRHHHPEPPPPDGPGPGAR